MYGTQQGNTCSIISFAYNVNYQHQPQFMFLIIQKHHVNVLKLIALNSRFMYFYLYFLVNLVLVSLLLFFFQHFVILFGQSHYQKTTYLPKIKKKVCLFAHQNICTVSYKFFCPLCESQWLTCYSCSKQRFLFQQHYFTIQLLSSYYETVCQCVQTQQKPFSNLLSISDDGKICE